MAVWLVRWGIPAGLGARSRAIIEERFSWDRVITQWLALFDELLPSAKSA